MRVYSTNRLLCLVLASLVSPGSGQLASMIEAMINYYQSSGPTDLGGLLRQPRSASCQWAAWNDCVWPSAGDGRMRSDKYLDQLGGTCQQHWFFQLIRRNYADSLNNVFEYMKTTMVSESRAEPCGMCSYRQSCGYGGRNKCHLYPQGPKVTPLNIGEQLCSTRRGLKKPQASPCEMFRSVLQWNNPSNPCQVWPAVERNLRLPQLSDNLRQQLSKIEFMRCAPDAGSGSSTLRVGGGPFEGQQYPNRCQCCCFPYEPVLVPRRMGRNGITKVWACQRTGHKGKTQSRRGRARG